MSIFKRNKPEDKKTELPVHLPCHLGIIMDGNGRWAKQRNLPRSAGHAAGAETFRRIATYCKKIGIPYLTVYAFSTENWKRPLEEIEGIFGLLESYLLESLDTMEENRVRIHFFGDLSPLPLKIRALCEKAERVSSGYDVQANICVNYGGRDEMLRAMRRLAQECRDGTLAPEQITEQRFSDYLDSAGIPDPELIIRPGGESRISNFLLWQSAYSEFYVTDVLWPDFSTADIDRALNDFNRRNRRFGGVNE